MNAVGCTVGCCIRAYELLRLLLALAGMKAVLVWCCQRLLPVSQYALVPGTELHPVLFWCSCLLDLELVGLKVSHHFVIAS